jgi:hypothetical protein
MLYQLSYASNSGLSPSRARISPESLADDRDNFLSYHNGT